MGSLATDYELYEETKITVPIKVEPPIAHSAMRYFTTLCETGAIPEFRGLVFKLDTNPSKTFGGNIIVVDPINDVNLGSFRVVPGSWATTPHILTYPHYTGGSVGLVRLRDYYGVFTKENKSHFGFFRKTKYTLGEFNRRSFVHALLKALCISTYSKFLENVGSQLDFLKDIENLHEYKDYEECGKHKESHSVFYTLQERSLHTVLRLYSQTIPRTYQAHSEICRAYNKGQRQTSEYWWGSDHIAYKDIKIHTGKNFRIDDAAEKITDAIKGLRNERDNILREIRDKELDMGFLINVKGYEDQALLSVVAHKNLVPTLENDTLRYNPVFFSEAGSTEYVKLDGYKKVTITPYELVSIGDVKAYAVQ